jgi:hypothetical protein
MPLKGKRRCVRLSDRKTLGRHHRLRAWPHQRRCNAQRNRRHCIDGSLAACPDPDDTHGLDQKGIGRGRAVSRINEIPGRGSSAPLLRHIAKTSPAGLLCPKSTPPKTRRASLPVPNSRRMDCEGRALHSRALPTESTSRLTCEPPTKRSLYACRSNPSKALRTLMPFARCPESVSTTFPSIAWLDGMILRS